MCAQAEMLSIQIIEGIQDTSMALSKYRLLICRAEPPDNDGELSRRFFRRIRKNLYAILEMENLSDEDRSTASRLMLRLNKLDPKKQQVQKDKEARMELRRAQLKMKGSDQVAPQPTTSSKIDLWKSLIKENDDGTTGTSGTQPSS
jgi:hypothetical protein